MCPKDPDFYTLLALKTAKGQRLAALEVYKNQSPKPWDNQPFVPGPSGRWPEQKVYVYVPFFLPDESDWAWLKVIDNEPYCETKYVKIQERERYLNLRKSPGPQAGVPGTPGGTNSGLPAGLSGCPVVYYRKTDRKGHLAGTPAGCCGDRVFSEILCEFLLYAEKVEIGQNWLGPPGKIGRNRSDLVKTRV